MSRRINWKLLASFFLFVLCINLNAYASDSTQAIIWNAAASNTDSPYSFTVSLKDTSYSAYIVNQSDTLTKTYSSGISLSSTKTNLVISNSYEEVGNELDSIVLKSRISDPQSLVLGTSSNFGILLTDNKGNIYNSYTIATTSSGYNLLIGSNIVLSINNQSKGINNYSAVPIPGTALLLGSSLLGLVGIGSRKKK